MYSYEEQKAWLFTDEGSRAFTRIRDVFLNMAHETGAARAGMIFEAARCGPSGDSWQIMAILDRMVELGDVRYVEDGKRRAWQYRLVEVLREPTP